MTTTPTAPTYSELLDEQDHLQERLDAAVAAMDEAGVVAIKERQKALPGLMYQATQRELQEQKQRLEDDQPRILTQIRQTEAEERAGRVTFEETVAAATATYEGLQAAARSARGEEERNRRRQGEIMEQLRANEKAERNRMEALAK